MRFVLLQLVLVTVAFLAVAAIVFRSGRAASALRYLRNGALLYIALMLVVGLTLYARQAF